VLDSLGDLFTALRKEALGQCAGDFVVIDASEREHGVVGSGDFTGGVVNGDELGDAVEGLLPTVAGIADALEKSHVLDDDTELCTGVADSLNVGGFEAIAWGGSDDDNANEVGHSHEVRCDGLAEGAVVWFTGWERYVKARTFVVLSRTGYGMIISAMDARGEVDGTSASAVEEVEQTSGGIDQVDGRATSGHDAGEFLGRGADHFVESGGGNALARDGVNDGETTLALVGDSLRLIDEHGESVAEEETAKYAEEVGHPEEVNGDPEIDYL